VLCPVRRLTLRTAIGKAQETKNQKDRDCGVEHFIPTALMGEHIVSVGYEHVNA
jgi:hypothetical protein